MKIVRIIARLNIGGPARHAVLLSHALHNGRHDTCLVTGVPEPHEGDMSFLLDGLGVRRVVIPWLRRSLHPSGDLRTLWSLVRLLWQEQPDIVHTHTAKAGTLGRVAGLVYNRFHPNRRALLIHTFHGHVLHGYFGTLPSRFFMAIERWLARRTDCLIAVSDAIKAELLRYGIGRPQQLVVVPVGLELGPLFQVEPPDGNGASQFRIGVVGRLVPVKNHRLLIDAVHCLTTLMPTGLVRCSIVGDGELRQELERDVAQRGLQGIVEFQGWRFDLPQVYGTVDCVCLSSLNEGTPLSLIEAMAAARPVVSTDVGGVRDFLGRPQAEQPHPRFCVLERGLVVRSGDVQGFAEALRFLAGSPDLRRQLGEASRGYIQSRFTTERLVRDLEELYETLRTQRQVS